LNTETIETEKRYTNLEHLLHGLLGRRLVAPHIVVVGKFGDGGIDHRLVHVGSLEAGYTAVEGLVIAAVLIEDGLQLVGNRLAVDDAQAVAARQAHQLVKPEGAW